MPSSRPPAILTERLSFGFGKRPVLKDLNISIPAGQVVALAGSNGAGKTTLLSVIAGSLQPQTGELLLHGTKYAGWGAARVARHGVTRTFQDLRLCAGLSRSITCYCLIAESDGAPFHRPGSGDFGFKRSACGEQRPLVSLRNLASMRLPPMRL